MLHAAVLALILAGPASSPPAGRAPVSREQADSLARKIEELAAFVPAGKRAGEPRSILFTEGEINSYLNLVLLPTVPTVRNVDLHIENGQLTASGLVDIDQIKRQLSLSPWNPVSFLKGRVEINVSGRYSNVGREGRGRVTIDEVRAGSVPIPISVLEQIVATSTRSAALPDGIDISEPFRLPPPLRGLRLQPGKAFLEL
jgi:hypothetical protein